MVGPYAVMFFPVVTSPIFENSFIVFPFLRRSSTNNLTLTFHAYSESWQVTSGPISSLSDLGHIIIEREFMIFHLQLHIILRINFNHDFYYVINHIINNDIICASLSKST